MAVATSPARASEPTDQQLVVAIRRGDDRAFEQLYARYQRRIAAFVFGMVKDHGRAEDITQEVFVSALRRMRKTERPIAFKPWIYEIAKNACIDAYRRGRRAEEVSYDADDRLSPADRGRLVATGPGPDAAVDAKQELDHLCGAFGGLSDSHHEILVMRELEGRSYKDIGERMGLSRPAVESTLFRARKRLGEEYDELASGARCRLIQALIAAGATLGRRDQRKLARHVSHCQPCRRLALSAGLEVQLPHARRIAERLAGLLPLPALARLRRGAGGDGSWMTHVPSFADPLSSGWGKGAAGLAALVLAGAGAGVTTLAGPDKRDERGTGYRAPQARTVAAPGGAASRRASAGSGERRAIARRERDSKRAGGAGGGPGAAGRGAPSATDSPAGGDSDPVALRTPTVDAPTRSPVDVPSVDAPAGVPSVQEAADSVQQTTDGVTGALPDVDETVDHVTKPLPPADEVVPEVTEPLEDAVGDATGVLGP